MTTLRERLAKALQKGNYELTHEGIVFPEQGIKPVGEYFTRVNGGKWSKTKNIITDEGFAHMLNVTFGSTAKPAGYYLALFSGASAPAANWTAANFAAAASEIVSMTEGYSAATRPAWTPANTNNGSIDNLAAKASVTIVTASQLNVTGAALLTNSTRGGTTGVLVSAFKEPTTRVFNNGDTFEIGYRVSLTR